jgi:folate-dependent phosphoribosylglycinamide formyltransferase PurN
MKIGFILDSIKVSWYIKDLIDWIKKNPNLNLEVLLIQNVNNKREPIFSGGFSKIFNRILFKIVNVLEKSLIFKKYPQYKKHFLKYNLRNMNIRELNVEFDQSNNQRKFNYNDKTINKIKKLNLDIIIRGGSGILTGKILNSSKFGIISFHHGDNLVNRGSPAGFWEVYEKNPKTGFTIQILTEQLDAGNVLKRGNFRTEQFYYLNQIILIERSNHYMKTILSNISKTGSLPLFLKNYPYYNKIYKTPNFIETIRYLFNITCAKFKNYFINKFFNKVWYIGYQDEAFNKISFYKSKIIKNPKNSFLADPFVIEHQEENYVFAEEYNFNNKKGKISVYKISKNNSQKLGVALEENFHLSFPYIFKYKNDYYMLPETGEINEIRIYKCEQFPLKWKYEKTIFKDIKSADSMIFNFNNLWWLITTFSNSGHGNESELQIFYSMDGPLTDNWISFKKNPAYIDPFLGRNGGILNHDNKIFRVAQSFGFNSYGEKINIQEITQLDPDNFVEKNYCIVEPNFSKNLIGMHHFHNNNNFTVYDFCKLELKMF